jgi:phenylalanyl-tRNA synthetase beta chain
VIALIEDIAGGTLVGVADVFEPPAAHEPVSATLSDVNALLGTALAAGAVEDILSRFEWDFSRDGERFTVTPPWERTDLVIPADLIEEIGRVHGYRTLAGVLPDRPAQPPQVNKRFYYSDKIRHLLAEMGYSEVYTYTLAAQGEVALANPFASDKSSMRATLTPGITQALDLNAANAAVLGLDDIRLFELGTVFREQGEYLFLAIGVRAVRGKQSKLTKQLEEDAHALVAALGGGSASPSPVARERARGEGVVEIDVDTLLPSLPDPVAYDPPLPFDPAARYTAWPVYPAVLRDIAVWVPVGTPAEEVLAVIIEVAPDTLVRHDQFDSFEKDGRVSYAWHLVFQSRERTLTDAEVGQVMDAVTAALNGREGWTVR